MVWHNRWLAPKLREPVRAAVGGSKDHICVGYDMICRMSWMSYTIRKCQWEAQSKAVCALNG